MKRRNGMIRWLVLLLTAVLVFSGYAAAGQGGMGKTARPETTAEPGPLEAAQRLADYLFEHGELPEGFLTKQEAKALGWDSRYNVVSMVAPGMSLGGDYFTNYEGRLPRVKGRKYYEADCFYRGGRRNAYRIIYSNDGHVWYTEDHYETFLELFPSNPEGIP